MVRFLQQVGVPHQIHDHTMGLTHVTVDQGNISSVQLQVENVTSGGVAQLKFLDHELISEKTPPEIVKFLSEIC